MLARDDHFPTYAGLTRPQDFLFEDFMRELQLVQLTTLAPGYPVYPLQLCALSGSADLPYTFYSSGTLQSARVCRSRPALRDLHRSGTLQSGPTPHRLYFQAGPASPGWAFHPSGAP